MITLQQLIRNGRCKFKRKKSKTPALKKNPQKRGICLKLFQMAPRKPNSARRKCAKVALCNKINIICYIPGGGHKLIPFSHVLVRGGATKDLPSLHYKLIRGKFDLYAVLWRRQGRSKYGALKPFV